MCNAVSEAISAYNNGREVLGGNFTKIPETLIEARRVITAIKSTNPRYNQEKNVSDSFVKQNVHKAVNFADEKEDYIELVMGIASLKNDRDKLRNGTAFLVNYTASKTIEKAMETEKGSKLLNKFSESIPKGFSKVFDLDNETTKKVVNISKYVIAGATYQFIADKFGEVGGKFTEKAIDSIRNGKGLNKLA